MPVVDLTPPQWVRSSASANHWLEEWHRIAPKVLARGEEFRPIVEAACSAYAGAIHATVLKQPTMALKGFKQYRLLMHQICLSPKQRAQGGFERAGDPTAWAVFYEEDK